MIKKLDYILKLLSIGFLIACFVFMFIVWFVAFLNGGSVIFSINSYGEMWLEAALWCIVFPVVFVYGLGIVEEIF